MLSPTASRARMKTDRQQAYVLIGYFLKRYQKTYGTTPPGFNRHALSHGFEGLVQDYPGRGEEIIDYFFDVYPEHAPVKFTYEYGKIVEQIEADRLDAEERKKIRRATQERMRIVTNSRKGTESSNPE